MSRIEQKPDLYAAFMRDFWDAGQSPDMSLRAKSFDFFNTQMTPALICEASFFQLFLYKVAQTWLVEGQAVRMHISQDFVGAPCNRWAQENQITHIMYSKAEGGLSFLLEPADTSLQYAAALCFPGTGPAYKRDILCARDYPRGVLDDLHHQGVGYGGFLHHRDAWLELVRDVTREGRPLLLTGHSLGAAYASELFVWVNQKLPPKQAKLVTLASWYPPGLRPSTLAQLVAYRERITLVRHDMDVTGWCGAGHPAGRVLRTRDMIGTTVRPWQVPHAVPQFALRRLRGQQPRFTYADSDGRGNFLIAEGLRRIGGFILRPWLKRST